MSIEFQARNLLNALRASGGVRLREQLSALAQGSNDPAVLTAVATAAQRSIPNSEGDRREFAGLAAAILDALKGQDAFDNKGPKLYQIGECITPSLSRTINETVEGGSVVMGEFRHLVSVLKSAGFADETIGRMNYFLVGARDGTLAHPILAGTVAVLLRSNASDLVVCAMDKGARFEPNMERIGAAAVLSHARPKREYSIQNLDGLRELSATDLRSQVTDYLSASNEREGANALFISAKLREKTGDPFARFSFPESHLYHEGVHHEDDRFHDLWVRANLALASRGEKPDDLFRDFSMNVLGYPIVSEGLLKLHTELRAYHVSQFISTRLLGLQDQPEKELAIKGIHLTQAIMDTLSSLSDGRNALERFGLPTDPTVALVQGKSFVPQWEQLVLGPNSVSRQMQRTIDRAFPKASA